MEYQIASSQPRLTNEILNYIEQIKHSLIEKYETLLKEKDEVIKFKDELLIHQDRFSVIGENFENIAHQWKQPLSSMSASLTGLQIEKMINSLTDEEFEESTNNILVNIDYLSETIDCFQNFFNDTHSETVFDIQTVIEKVLLIIKGNLRTKQIKVVVNAHEDCLIQGYENEFMQALINILNNASDALMGTKLGERTIEITVSRNDTTNSIQIEDSAGGIPQEIISKIFNHYFTTKEKKGTGIGLYLTKQIIEKNLKGSINVTNTQKGAMFVIEIPHFQLAGK